MVSDKQIGFCIRKLREANSLTQMALGERIGVSHQQIQKYETGQSRISVFRLQQIAAALNTPLQYFLIKDPLSTASELRKNNGLYNNPKERLKQRELEDELKMVENLFQKIKSNRLRQVIIEQLFEIIKIQN